MYILHSDRLSDFNNTNVALQNNPTPFRGQVLVNRFLVTGCTGFIGSQVMAALLHRGAIIRGLTRQKKPARVPDGVDIFCGDLARPETLSGVATDIDTIIHAAGIAHTLSADVGRHRQTTVEGTRRLLAEAKEYGVRDFVFVSSVKAMAEPGDECIDETEIGLPHDEYGLARRGAEDLVLSAGRSTGMHVCVLRPALVYGPGCKGNLASMLNWVGKGLFPPLPDSGNRRSMVDVRDLVNAILLAAERKSAQNRIFIITDGEEYSTRRIYGAMRQAFGLQMPTWSIPVWLLRSLGKTGDLYRKTAGRPALFDSATCSRLLDSACYRSRYAATDLGFRPDYCFEDAVPEMVAEYRRSQLS